MNDAAVPRTVAGASSALPDPLPLFPLNLVLFPGGRLQLKVFEARYLDLIGQCLRQRTPFGVVCLRQGADTRQPGQTVAFEPVGVLTRVLEVDAESPGILKVACVGGQRFRLRSAQQAGSEGLWMASGVEPIAADAAVTPVAGLRETAEALDRAINTLSLRDPGQFGALRHLDDAGWVANRWCELLPISLPAKQRLMELDDPELRLRLVDDFLRQQNVI